jgi:hypothetical protein
MVIVVNPFRVEKEDGWRAHQEHYGNEKKTTCRKGVLEEHGGSRDSA